MIDFSDYSLELKKVYEKNPLIELQELYSKKELAIEPSRLLNILIAVRKEWETARKQDVQCGIIIDNIAVSNPEKNIKNHNYLSDFVEIIQSSDKESIVYFLDKDGFIMKSEYKSEKLQYQDLVKHSKRYNNVSIFLGIKGIDVIINGVSFENENRLENYSDVINYRKLLSISHYKDLLKRFFNERVQFDTFKNYFVYKGDLPKSLHGLLEKNPKLLKIKPEERFQKELEYFLRDNCNDKVLTEVRNKFGERYDVWVATSDDRLYVFEIKWLGKSITAEFNIFNEYNNPERALEGAYQLKKYVDDRESYSEIIRGDFRIYCGILLVYDAREDMSDLETPLEFNEYPQIDLSQHYKIDKDNIPASQYFRRVIKN